MFDTRLNSSKHAFARARSIRRILVYVRSVGRSSFRFNPSVWHFCPAKYIYAAAAVGKGGKQSEKSDLLSLHRRKTLVSSVLRCLLVLIQFHFKPWLSRLFINPRDRIIWKCYYLPTGFDHRAEEEFSRKLIAFGVAGPHLDTRVSVRISHCFLVGFTGTSDPVERFCVWRWERIGCALNLEGGRFSWRFLLRCQRRKFSKGEEREKCVQCGKEENPAERAEK